MSHFGNNGGGRTRMSTKVFLNIYDLSPINQYLYPIGFGLYHTGVEIMGTEYTFASGAGIFNATPKDGGPNAIFREQIEMGIYDGSTLELNNILDELRNGKFGPNDYNIIERNCNHFANTLCYKLLNKQLPGYINRLADIGMCCSCLLPKSLLNNAPVGDNDTSKTGSSSTSSFLVKAPPGRMVMNDRSSSSSSTPKIFHGTGARLGGTASTTSASSNGSMNSSSNNNNEEKKSLLSSFFTTTSIKNSNNVTTNMNNHDNTNNSNPQQRHDADLLTDRREKARKAALARLEQQQQQQQKSDKSL